MIETELDTSGLSELGKAAVWYCENGFAIIPIEPRGKRPYAKVAPHGLNDWFDNPADAHRLWSMMPDLNIAIVCGSPSHGLLVLDFDIDEEKGKDGTATLGSWEDSYGELPATCTAITGSGGMHYLYRTSRTNIRPSANQELGVDVRCDGSYIVVPPSVHPNGREYAWNEGDSPWEREISTADGSVYDFLDHVQRNGGEDEDRPKATGFSLPATIKKGQRDVTLHKYASSLRAKGRSDEEILAELVGVNMLRCTVPLDLRDIQRIARSASAYERGSDGGKLSDREIGAPGGRRTFDLLPASEFAFRSDKGHILPNELAKAVMKRNHTTYIDGAPAVWTGQRWEFDKQAFFRATLELADDSRKAHRDEVYSYVRAKMRHVTSDKDMDLCRYVQFANATYDVMAQSEVEPNHHMLITGTLPIDLDLNAPYGFADEFLKQLADGDEATVTVLQEIIGACMCNANTIAQAPMLIGRGKGEASNGKSTFLNMLRSLLGPRNVSSLDIVTLGQRFQAGRIVGKLANLGDDIPDGFLRGEELSTFKKLVTGDSIYTDVKNGEGFEFRPHATMVFSMNSVPRLQDTTEGVFRRLAFVPFRNKFSPDLPGYDPYIASKLAMPENLQRFAALGLMALPDLIKRGQLTPITDMVTEVERVRIDNSIVRRWIWDENITASDVHLEPTQDVYDRFRQWCDKSGENFRATKNTFTREIQATFENISVGVRFSQRHGKKMRTYLMGNKSTE